MPVSKMVNSTWLADTIVPTADFISLFKSNMPLFLCLGFPCHSCGKSERLSMQGRLHQRICCPPSVPTRFCRRASSLPNSATTTPHQGHRGSLYAHRLYLHVHNRYQEDTRRMIVCAPASASCPGANRRSGHAPPARHVIDNFSCTNLPAGP